MKNGRKSGIDQTMIPSSYQGIPCDQVISFRIWCSINWRIHVENSNAITILSPTHNYPLALSGVCQSDQPVRCANHNFCSSSKFTKILQIEAICAWQIDIQPNPSLHPFIHAFAVRSPRLRSPENDAATALQFSRHCRGARGYVTSKSNGIVYYNKCICVARCISWILKCGAVQIAQTISHSSS